MANTKKVISEQDIAELVRLDTLAKKAKAEYDEAKERLTKDLPDGVYTCDSGKLTKSTSVVISLDTKALEKDFPDIKETYRKESQRTTVTCQNLMTSKKWF